MVWRHRDVVLNGPYCSRSNFFKSVLYITGKDYKLAMAIGLSFTALTLWTNKKICNG